MKRRTSQITLRAAVLVIAAFAVLLPIAAGLWHSASAAFGHLPALKATGPNLDAWAQLLGLAGFGTALRLTLVTGFASTFTSLILALALAALIGKSQVTTRFLAPFLAVPHAAVAVGLGFVLAPSGWISRAIAPALGWGLPPDVATVNDAFGLALTLGLVIKEMPFLLLVILAAMTQIPVRAQMTAGQSLGYSSGAVWVKVILPQLWPLIRLPVYVVLIFGLSVIDMALILGPSNPPTAAVMVARLFFSPDLAQLPPAFAGAILLLAVGCAAIAALWAIERALTRFGPVWLRRGGRGGGIDMALGVIASFGAAVIFLGAVAMVSLVLWSLAWRWPYPMIWPQSWSLHAWGTSFATFGPSLQTTAIIALISTALSVMLAILWLETSEKSAPKTEILIYLPLLVPQISFLFGMNALLLSLGMQGSLVAVIWGHSLFVFPYVMIALAGPWRGFDPHLVQSAASLGASRFRQLMAVKLPVLAAPISAAAAIGVAVSVAQYLPTLFLGAGRITTLTTEAVTLASSSDRRITGVVTTLQAALPLAAYLAAFAIPAVMHRNRRALKGYFT
jgi:putative thiamine transport system permease protein